MKLRITLILAALSLPLTAGAQQPPPPAQPYVDPVQRSNER